MKRALYTVTNEDKITVPLFRTKGWEYICFTCNPDLKSDFWDIRLIRDKNIDKQKLLRKVKILVHKYLPGYKLTIFCDSNMVISDNLDTFIGKHWTGEDMVLSRHPKNRKCVKQELLAILSKTLDNKVIIRKQVKNYFREKYPENYGLHTTGLIIRREPNTNVIAFLEFWWYEVFLKSKYDQLSFNYSAWKFREKIVIKTIEYNNISKYYEVKNYESTKKASIINHIISKRAYKSYLHVSENSRLFRRINIYKKHNVSVKPGSVFHLQPFHFFKLNTKKYDIIYTDSDYNTYLHIYNSLEILNTGGVLVVGKIVKNSDSYNDFITFYSERDDYKILYFDIDEGIGIISREKPLSKLEMLNVEDFYKNF